MAKNRYSTKHNTPIPRLCSTQVTQATKANNLTPPQRNLAEAINQSYRSTSPPHCSHINWMFLCPPGHPSQWPLVGSSFLYTCFCLPSWWLPVLHLIFLQTISIMDSKDHPVISLVVCNKHETESKCEHMQEDFLPISMLKYSSRYWWVLQIRFHVTWNIFRNRGRDRRESSQSNRSLRWQP
jgi:hypothetical protein